MKKKYLTLFISALIPFGVLTPRAQIKYSDDTPIRFNLSAPSLKIVQFADLHLTYGFDKNDHLTFDLIKNITEATKPDLVVFTGDQTLSISTKARYLDLTKLMESLKTPWTFIFGNHDYDYASRAKIIDKVYSVNPQYLYFKEGPKLDEDGVGNFVFNYYYENEPFYNLYFLDSKEELKKKEPDGLTIYNYLSPAQVEWYDQKAKVDKVNEVYSSVFMHIPLVQFRLSFNVPDGDTIINPPIEQISSQSKDTGFFDSMLTNGMSQAVFVGHDHRNNFVFTHQGIKLVYGRNSGYNAYGGLTRGARIIEITPTSEAEPLLTTKVIFEDLSYEV